MRDNSLMVPSHLLHEHREYRDLWENSLLPSFTHQLPAEFGVPLIFFTLEAVFLSLLQIWSTGS